jgi:transcriptional regulator with XRE-family HTH domain
MGRECAIADCQCQSVIANRQKKADVAFWAMSESDHVGVVIGRLLKAHRVSQSELARKLGVSRQAVGLWLNGTNDPTLSALIEISRIFNVSLSVFGDTNVEKPLLDNELRQLPPELSSYLVRLWREEIRRARKIGKLD